MSRDDFEPLAWAARGIPREEALRWWEGGLTLAETMRWRERFSAEETIAWRAAGVTSPFEARSWCVAGVGANEVAGWRDAGIGFAEATAWHEFGYSLEEAKKLKAHGKTPSDSFRRRVQNMPSQPMRSVQSGAHRRGLTMTGQGMTAGVAGLAQSFVQAMRGRQGHLLPGYLSRRWLDDEALVWAQRGIDAADALVWKELGIAPEEAARLQKAGQTPVATMRAWWDAGIPFDEVAAWLGAGLTPAEAAEQRAKGITAERAAVLRALRDPDETEG
jgi:hypothetical protein